MFRKWRTMRPSHTTVVSYLALFLALGTGGAYAANTIGSSDVINESLRSKDIKNATLRNVDIRNSAVTTQKLREGAVEGVDILNGAVAHADLANDAVNSDNVVNESLTSADLATDSVNAAKIADGAITISDIAGADASGSVSLSGVANGRCSQVTLSVAGAQVGEMPLVATNGAIQNGVLLYAMRVESAGHVEASICNFSGTSMTPITDLPVRVITIG
jgi:hypothetical protein